VDRSKNGPTGTVTTSPRRKLIKQKTYVHADGAAVAAIADLHPLDRRVVQALLESLERLRHLLFRRQLLRLQEGGAGQRLVTRGGGGQGQGLLGGRLGLAAGGFLLLDVLGLPARLYVWSESIRG
jgi:hypothetical protein